MRITIRHHFDFGADRAVVGDDLVRPQAWDALRTRTSGAFAISRDRAELERTADERPEIGERARQIDAWLEERGVQTLASYGVGGAVLELWLERLRPERQLRLTDYAPATVERLRELLPSAEVTRHNLVVDPPLEADMHLFHRIDTELANREWRQVLDRFGALPILVVAAEVADFSHVLAEIGVRFRRRAVSRAGWLRTQGALESLWRRNHVATPIHFHDLQAWWLEPRRPRASPSASA